MGFELKKLHHHLAQLLYYVRARGTSPVEFLDNDPCYIRDIVDFGVHRGTMVALLVEEICTSRRLRDFVGPPSSLLDEGLEDMLEGYEDVTSHVMLRVSPHDIVHDAH